MPQNCNFVVFRDYFIRPKYENSIKEISVTVDEQKEKNQADIDDDHDLNMFSRLHFQNNSFQNDLKFIEAQLKKTKIELSIFSPSHQLLHITHFVMNSIIKTNAANSKNEEIVL